MNAQLLRHAIANVWCNPAQDRQFVYKLARLTPRYGTRDHIRLYYEHVVMPTPEIKYHIYQIGHALPKRLGLPLKTQQWLRLSDLANDELLHTELYIESGIQFPRHSSYIRLTKNRNVIVAVAINDRIGDLEDQSLYLRFYSNAFFNSVRSEGRRYMRVDGLTVKTQDQLIALQRRLRIEVEELGGWTYHYVNGRFVHNLSLTTAQVGDVVEYVIDGSLKRKVVFKIDDLKAFHSTRDAAQKYILHYDDPSVDQIEYLDDLDVFLVKPSIADRYMGITYHRNTIDWLRMLTHKDYSIPRHRLDEFVEVHPVDPRSLENADQWPSDDWTSLSGMELHVYLRDSGYERPLIVESSRISELYKLPSKLIMESFTGVQGSLPLWRAANLEDSEYVRFMSALPREVHPITYNDVETTSQEKQNAQEFVGKVYGYHAASKYLSDTPTRVLEADGRRYVPLAYTHQTNATVFEYSEHGVLLGHYSHIDGEEYPTRNAEATVVEAITGHGTNRPNTVYGTVPVNLKDGYNFRAYVRRMWRDIPRGDWLEVTHDSDYGYVDTDTVPNRWVWSVDPTTHYGAVRQDDSFFCRELTLDRHAGYFGFTLRAVETHQGYTGEEDLDIPYGDLDVYLNGKALIENLDYRVVWPRVIINNLEYLKPTQQNVLVRAYGFCREDLSRNEVSEFGFMRFGALSHNHRYDIHEHKIRRVVVDGNYHHPDDVVYAEDVGAVIIQNERNGAPYTIQTPPTIFRNVYEDDGAARLIDDAKDRAISDYMTLKFPVEHPDTPDFIEAQYHVYSPFANKILQDLIKGHLVYGDLFRNYSETDIREWCKEYEWLLPYDICNTEYDQDHIEVYPHWGLEPVELPLIEYNLYVRIIKHYLRHTPDVSAFVKVKPLA